MRNVFDTQSGPRDVTLKTDRLRTSSAQRSRLARGPFALPFVGEKSLGSRAFRFVGEKSRAFRFTIPTKPLAAGPHYPPSSNAKDMKDYLAELMSDFYLLLSHRFIAHLHGYAHTAKKAWWDVTFVLVPASGEVTSSRRILLSVSRFVIDIAALSRSQARCLRPNAFCRLNHSLQTGACTERANTIHCVIVRDGSVAGTDEEVLKCLIESMSRDRTGRSKQFGVSGAGWVDVRM